MGQEEREGYTPLTEGIKKVLRDIVGDEDLLDSPEDLINYSYDAFVPESVPEAVLFPASVQEVSRIMEIAYREGIPVTPRGAGTNISGGSVPIRGGLVLSFTRMNKILEINRPDRYAIVQPGVVNAYLQEQVARRGLFYPPDPASMNVCTIGGNVAENAGGPRGVKYGVTRDYLLGLEVVLADGQVVRTGGRTVKNVTGYDLTGLFCGSEGTLGIVTEIILKLLPMPESKRTIQALFPDLDAAGQTVAKIMGAGILPVALELMDSVVINLLEDSVHIGLPRDVEGLLLIEVDGPEDAVQRQVEMIANFCRTEGAKDVRTAHTEEENEALWMARRSAFGVMARSSPTCLVEDVTVPVSQLPQMVRDILDISKRYGIVIGVLAHAGDGNMHPLILTDRRDQEEWRRVEEAIGEIFHRAAALGGTLSGEHGIGLAKDNFLPLVLNESTRSLMRDIKRTLDPKGILNPGKFV